MNKKLLSVLSLVLLISVLPACGKKGVKKSDKKAHHVKKEHKNKKPKAHKSYKKDVVSMDEEDMK